MKRWQFNDFVSAWFAEEFGQDPAFTVAFPKVPFGIRVAQLRRRHSNGLQAYVISLAFTEFEPKWAMTLRLKRAAKDLRAADESTAPARAE